MVRGRDHGTHFRYVPRRYFTPATQRRFFEIRQRRRRLAQLARALPTLPGRQCVLRGTVEFLDVQLPPFDHAAEMYGHFGTYIDNRHEGYSSDSLRDPAPMSPVRHPWRGLWVPSEAHSVEDTDSESE